MLRELEDRFGDRISPWELPFAGLRARDLLDAIEDFWERDAQPPGHFATRNHNLAVYGWDVHDANTRSADACRRLIREPTDALFKQLVQNANERTALRVLAPGPEGQQELSPLMTAAALGADGTVQTPGEGDGIETLIVALGANNALGAVTELRVCWSARSSYEDPAAKRGYTVWTPAHFREELDMALETVRVVRARHVIFATVPHVTIPPVSRGVGPKLAEDPRYFPYYTRPWIGDGQFHPSRHPYITGAQARDIDTASTSTTRRSRTPYAPRVTRAATGTCSTCPATWTGWPRDATSTTPPRARGGGRRTSCRRRWRSCIRRPMPASWPTASVGARPAGCSRSTAYTRPRSATD